MIPTASKPADSKVVEDQVSLAVAHFNFIFILYITPEKNIIAQFFKAFWLFYGFLKAFGMTHYFSSL